MQFIQSNKHTMLKKIHYIIIGADTKTHRKLNHLNNIIHENVLHTYHIQLYCNIHLHKPFVKMLPAKTVKMV